MRTLLELLNRIRWDEKFSQAEFKIAFYDRILHQLVYLPFKEVVFEQTSHYFFHFVDQDGQIHNVPLHRIKKVYRNGELIWARKDKQSQLQEPGHRDETRDEHTRTVAK